MDKKQKKFVDNIKLQMYNSKVVELLEVQKILKIIDESFDCFINITSDDKIENICIIYLEVILLKNVPFQYNFEKLYDNWINVNVETTYESLRKYKPDVIQENSYNRHFLRYLTHQRNINRSESKFINLTTLEVKGFN